MEASGYESTTTDFLKAAAHGDRRALELMFKNDIPLDSTNADGWSALHLASQGGHEDAVTFLLEAGISINTPSDKGVIPLMLAAQQGEASMVRFLLQQGASPNLKDQINRSALILAIDGNHPRCVEELAPYSRDQLDTALLYASAQGKHHIIDALTSFGASVHCRHDGGMSPLMLAAQNGHTTTVHTLLGSGSNRYAIDEHGWTAAQIAAAANHITIANLLNQEPDDKELVINEPTDTESVEWINSTSHLSTPAPKDPDPQAKLTDSNSSDNQGEMPWNRPGEPEGSGALGLLDPKNLDQPKSNSASSSVGKPQHIPFIAGQTLSSNASTPEQLSTDLHMRGYQQKPLPLIVEKVTPQAAEVRMLYGSQQRVKVPPGGIIPNTPFKVIRIQPKFNHSKMTDGKPADISVVEIKDTRTGQRRELTSQLPANASEPIAVIEDQSGTNGVKTYAARTGQSFQSANGDTYTVTDIRPNQIILTHLKSGQVTTLPLGQ